MLKAIGEVYRYREMLKNLVRKDLRTRYKGSVLGFLWTFVSPLLQLAVYTVVFSTVMRLGIDRFYIFLFVALLPWIFFSASVQSSTSVIVANKDLVKKIYFPREILPLSVVAANGMNLLFGFAIVFPVLFISGIGITGAVIYLPFVMVTGFVLALAFSLLFAGLNVYFRDLEHLLSIGMMAWFYFTPIVYPQEWIPEQYRLLFSLNPMKPVILSYRDILYHGTAPDFVQLGWCLAAGLLLLAFGYWMFLRLQRNFAEEI